MGRQYLDSDGNECSLQQLVKRGPEWAANRIRALEDENENLKASIIMNDKIASQRIAELERERDSLKAQWKRAFEGRGYRQG